MTKIFKTYEEFLQRTDKSVNGVTPEFAAAYKTWKSDNESNEGCWNCRYCTDCVGCSECIACRNCRHCVSCNACRSCDSCSFCSSCRFCTDCSECVTCRECADCINCIFCNECVNCRFCAYERFKDNEKHLEFGGGFPKIPVIRNIHQKVLEAARMEDALDMTRWHSCETTHCRAGWVVYLAGEAGRELEQKTSPLIAAMQIYHASSTIKVSPSTFYEAEELALANMRLCAELERELVEA